MTLIEAAARLGVRPATLRQQIASGALRATKRGRDWWVTPAAVARYEREHRGKVGRPNAGLAARGLVEHNHSEKDFSGKPYVRNGCPACEMDRR